MNHLLQRDTKWARTSNCTQVFAVAKKILPASEKNYCQLEKKAMSLVQEFGVKRFQVHTHYRLQATVSNSWTNEEYILPLTAARLQHWAILLSTYNYDIHVKSTLTHTNADGLSQLPISDMMTEG